MHIAKNDVPVRIGIPGATARQQVDFGDATGYGKISGEYFSLPAGMDISPLLQGLEGDMCHAPHWGYVIEGAVTTTYSDGKQEAVHAGDLFYWPPGHTVKVDENAELILFSPQHEHSHVIDHMLEKMKQMA
ncbi:cupin domain-containing protein [Lacisediminimonas profundi]|uniref:cupin domain-containing protein n=1 Tax=Lacisediminimonas profundi TaxID=2603856 RepID=UPI00124B4F3D|nr:cupin domain-containing protein [Lacisediminimonas profundi]